MKKIKLGVIPAGGLGTRFLPASAAVPKEMFPVFDTPLVAFAIEEMVDAGVETLYIIVSPWKKPLFERYLNSAEELSERLLAQGKTALSEKLAAMQKWPKIILIEQEKPQGLAQAINLCRPHLGDESFLLILPDEVMLKNTDLSDLPSKALVKVYEQSGLSNVGLYKVPLNEVSSYGVASFTDTPKFNLSDHPVWELNKLVEKPPASQAPSQFMLPGRYLLTADFWQTLEVDLKKLEGLKEFAEVHMTDALDRMAQNNNLLGIELKNIRYDVGQPMGYFDLIKDFVKQKEDLK